MNTKCSKDISYAWIKSVVEHKDVETTIYFLVMVEVLEVLHVQVLWRQQVYFYSGGIFLQPIFFHRFTMCFH